MNTLSAVWCARGEKRIAVFPTEMAPTLVMASLACILDQDVSRLQAFEAIIVTICCPVRSIIQPPAGNPRSQADVSHSPSACSNRVSYLPPLLAYLLSMQLGLAAFEATCAALLSVCSHPFLAPASRLVGGSLLWSWTALMVRLLHAFIDIPRPIARSRIRCRV
jgi:hypothetical protein